MKKLRAVLFVLFLTSGCLPIEKIVRTSTSSTIAQGNKQEAPETTKDTQNNQSFLNPAEVTKLHREDEIKLNSLVVEEHKSDTLQKSSKIDRRNSNLLDGKRHG